MVWWFRWFTSSESQLFNIASQSFDTRRRDSSYARRERNGPRGMLYDHRRSQKKAMEDSFFLCKPSDHKIGYPFMCSWNFIYCKKVLCRDADTRPNGSAQEQFLWL